jgi:phosphopantothenoylcysteine decarboxylase / phosphopantothenate---cysteine ligase
MQLAGKRILLGVTGSIAAYKSVVLLRALQKEGAEVRIALTPGATKFVSPLTFTTLAQHPAFEDLWTTEARWSEHVHLGRWADLLVVAPCTLNTMARLAHGMCENALDAVYLSATCPVLLAPAADHEMMGHPRTQENLEKLLATPNHHLAQPAEGYLASGFSGQGRMAEPDDIVSQIIEILKHPVPTALRPLAGKKVLITAGPTQEPLDPVRYLTNRSSGKMGYALATEALRLGAEVNLVSGPVHLTAPVGAKFYPVEHAAELFETVQKLAPEQDVLIMAAAVADYRPAEVHTSKMKKSGEQIVLNLEKTEDTLAWVGEHKKDEQLLVGFALETDHAEEHAQDKLERKNADIIVLNSLGDAGAGFGHDTNQITIIDKKGGQSRYELKDKSAVAADIWQFILQYQA